MNTLKNGLWNSLANLFGVLAGVISSILIVRSLSAVDYGRFSYYIWLFGLFGTVGSFAFPLALTKIRSELLGRKENEQANQLTIFVYFILLIINLLISICIFFWFLLSQEEYRNILLIISFIILPTNLAAAMRSTLWGSEHYKSVSLTLIVAILLQCSGVIYVYFLDANINNYFLVTLIPNFFQFLILGAIIWNKFPGIRPILKLNLLELQLLRKYFAFLLPSMLILVYQTVVWQRSEVFFLEKFSDFANVGYYSLAFTIYAIFLDLGWALVNAYYPAISRLYGSGMWETLQSQFLQGVKLAVVFAIPFSFGGIITIKQFVLILYGEKALPVVDVVQILFIGLVPGIISGILNLTMSAAGGVWLHVAAGIGISILNILLDLILIPSHHALGAALANTISQISLVSILILLLNRYLHLNLPWKFLIKVVGGGILTTLLLPGLFFLYAGDNLTTLIVAILFSGLAYTLFVWHTGLLNSIFRKGLILEKN